MPRFSRAPMSCRRQSATACRRLVSPWLVNHHHLETQFKPHPANQHQDSKIQALFSAAPGVMKLSLLSRRISHFSYRPPEIQRRRSSFLVDSVPNEVLSILGSSNPVEPALEALVPFLSSELVSSIIRQEPNLHRGFRFFIWAVQRKRVRSSLSSKLVLEMLAKENGFDLYWRAVDEVKKSGAPIVPCVFTVLISGYMKMGFPEKAVESFGKMKDFECEPDVFTYNAILHVLMRKRLVMLALAVYNRMSKPDCRPNRVTFSIMIDGLCKNGETSEALKMFDEMARQGIKPNRYTYTIIISGLCQEGRVDVAYRLLLQMKESGCSNDFVAYNALLNGFCKSGRMDEAFSLLKSFEKDGFVPGLRAYSSLIDGLFKVKRYDEAYGWYNNIIEGRAKGKVELDVVFYTIVMRGLSKAGKVRDAMELLREMTERGVVPDTYCYNALIEGLCDVGLLDRARSLQLEISALDCFPDAHTYTILICGMCRNGLVEEAERIFNEMERVGCFPSVVTFNALINGLCHAGNLEKANFLFYKMQVGRDPSVFIRLSLGPSRVHDSSSFKTMVLGLCESGRILKAYRILMQLAESGNLPDIITYNIMINGFCKIGNIDGALNLVKDLQRKGLSPDSITYGTLINGFHRLGREEEALGIFDKMVQSGIKPGPEIYRCLMKWSCHRRKVSSAFSLWLKYLKDCSILDDKVLKETQEHFEKGEVEKAVRGLAEMEIKLNTFSLAPYTILLIGFCWVGNAQEAFKIFSILKEFEVIVTPPSCAKLINTLCKQGNLDLATDIFLYTLENGFKLMPRICNYLLESLLQSKGQWTNEALDILSRMESQGYDLDAYLNPYTKSLLHGQKNMWDMVKRAPG